jgi:hypothetical protein
MVIMPPRLLTRGLVCTQERLQDWLLRMKTQIIKDIEEKPGKFNLQECMFSHLI